MSIRDLIETFDGAAVSANIPNGASTKSMESVRSAAFEAGYASGWDDAKVADENAYIRVQAEFERNVEAMTFTYHEALDRVRNEVTGFIDTLLSEFLPAIIPIAIVEHIRSELLTAADMQVDNPVEIIVSPNCKELVSGFLNGEASNNIELIEDASLAEFQVFMRIAKREKEINLAPLISELKFQFNAMSSPRTRVKDHG